MPPRIDLEPHKEEIITAFQGGKSAPDIRTDLKQKYGLNTSTRTLRNRLQVWGIRQRTVTRIDDVNLHERVRALYSTTTLSTKQILRVLADEGLHISDRSLGRLRRQLGIQLRIDDPELRQQREREIETVLLNELETGRIEGQGRRLLHSHLQRNGFRFPE
ncbi:hypothetical protein N7495_003190 [Penicillium taxi]|uniref:uncharacterized protein n=1 Tax=Penicillium taxi TaxID=168475 RepID=UPI0025458C20|nr:uncharacterized protein N7495_003190 [Penicillium taxi]KAJ5902662.1 hypothetical protein N7495_003190 [Penicillium taxi]